MNTSRLTSLRIIGLTVIYTGLNKTHSAYQSSLLRPIDQTPSLQGEGQDGDGVHCLNDPYLPHFLDWAGTLGPFGVVQLNLIAPCFSTLSGCSACV